MPVDYFLKSRIGDYLPTQAWIPACKENPKGFVALRVTVLGRPASLLARVALRGKPLGFAFPARVTSLQGRP